VYNGTKASFVESLDELEDLNQILGTGSFGVVKKVRRAKTGDIFAVKIMTLDVTLDELLHKKLLELKTLHNSQDHPFIVGFYGAFYSESKLSFLLEYMDCGTLADIIKPGPIPEKVIGKLAAQLLTGLQYLHRELHIIHRDIKPHNILVNSQGILKITDFGVSGELAHTQAMAKTFIGTVKYMSPNRIRGQPHSASSDIWSLGLTIAEAALGYYPYGHTEGLTFFQSLQQIANTPAPELPPDKFSPEFCSFIKDCLQKEEEKKTRYYHVIKPPIYQKVCH